MLRRRLGARRCCVSARCWSREVLIAAAPVLARVTASANAGVRSKQIVCVEIGDRSSRTSSDMSWSWVMGVWELGYGASLRTGFRGWGFRGARIFSRARLSAQSLIFRTTSIRSWTGRAAISRIRKSTALIAACETTRTQLRIPAKPQFLRPEAIRFRAPKKRFRDPETSARDP